VSRIGPCFERLQATGRRALVPFLTAGDPDPALTVSLMQAAVGAGADIIELGVPFSDPMADGPVIQRASERALARHTGLRQVLEMVRAFREQDAQTPVVLMGYLNPVEVMGYAAFAAAAAGAGVDGVLTVDLPPEEAAELVAALRRHALDPIFLIAPTTPPERARLVCAQASGFLYYVSLKGVTGSDRLDMGSVAEHVAGIRGLTGLPIGVGFGIRDAESAGQVAAVADAVVVGSALVRQGETHAGDPAALRAAVSALLSSMRRAMDAASRGDTGA
jgi:tryptophan synthase alpha chain